MKSPLSLNAESRITGLFLILLLISACGDGSITSDQTTAIVAPTITASTTSSTTSTTQSPTTTEAPSTTVSTTSALAGSGAVGVIGCSMTANAVSGYVGLGGSRLWDIQGEYAGASVGRWANDAPSGPMWTAFQSSLAADGEVEAVWWQLCTFGGSPRDGIESARVVLAELRSRVGDIPIFVSAQPEYNPVGSCNLAGDEGPAFMTEVAAELVATDGLQPGPLMGPLQAEQTNGGCHANGSGEQLLGTQLLSFFN